MPYKDYGDQRKWVLAHPERIKAINAKAYIRNKEKYQRSVQGWRAKNPGHAKWCSLRSGAIKRGIPFLITRDELIEWLPRQRQACSYCDLIDLSMDTKLPNNLLLRTFSIDRKNADLPYSIENIALACWFCNRGKGNVFTHEEWREIAQKYVKPKWMKKLEMINASR